MSNTEKRWGQNGELFCVIVLLVVGQAACGERSSSTGTFTGDPHVRSSPTSVPSVVVSGSQSKPASPAVVDVGQSASVAPMPRPDSPPWRMPQWLPLLGELTKNPLAVPPTHPGQQLAYEVLYGYKIPGLSRVTLQVFHGNSSHWQLGLGGDLASQLGATVERLCVLSRQRAWYAIHDGPLAGAFVNTYEQDGKYETVVVSPALVELRKEDQIPPAETTRDAVCW